MLVDAPADGHGIQRKPPVEEPNRTDFAAFRPQEHATRRLAQVAQIPAADGHPQAAIGRYGSAQTAADHPAPAGHGLGRSNGFIFTLFAYSTNECLKSSVLN